MDGICPDAWFRLVKRGALAVRPGLGSEATTPWLGVHSLNTYLLRARPTLGAFLGLGIQPCHLGQVIDPSECQSFHLQNCEVDDWKTAKIPSSCQMRQARMGVPSADGGAPYCRRWAGRRTREGPWLRSLLGRHHTFVPSCETGKTKLRACGNLVHLTHHRRVFQNATVNLGETAVQNRSLKCVTILSAGLCSQRAGRR